MYALNMKIIRRNTLFFKFSKNTVSFYFKPNLNHFRNFFCKLFGKQLINENVTEPVRRMPRRDICHVKPGGIRTQQFASII